MAPTRVEQTGRPRSPSRAPAAQGALPAGGSGLAQPETKTRGTQARTNHENRPSENSGCGSVGSVGHADGERQVAPTQKQALKGQTGQTGQTGQSFAERAARLPRTSTPLLVQGDAVLLRDIDRAPPGDPPQLRPRRRPLHVDTGGEGEGQEGEEKEEKIHGRGDGLDRQLSRQRSQYYEDAFSARDSHVSPAKERIRRESPVLAELRTNVMIGDEFTVITELSANLAVRYRRPLSSIVVLLQHNSCMCFGGSFDPAYVLTVSALPAELQPTTNKRNAALLQRHMEEALGVPSTRGLLRFAPVPESSFAYSGKTTAGHMDDVARRAGGLAYDLSSASTAGGSGGSGSGRSPTSAVSGVSGDGEAAWDAQGVDYSGMRARKSKARRRLSVKSLSSFRSPSPALMENPVPVASIMVDDYSPVSTQPPLPVIEERSPGVGSQETRREKRVQERQERWERQERQERQGRQERRERLERQERQEREEARRAEESKQPDPGKRARRTKSFVSTLFGRSLSRNELKA